MVDPTIKKEGVVINMDMNEVTQDAVLSSEQASDLVSQASIEKSVDMGHSFLHKGTLHGRSFVLVASAADKSALMFI